MKAHSPHLVVTGATGFLGQAVSIALAERGYTVHAITRNPSRIPPGIPTASTWDEPLPESTTHLVHLAGEPVAGLWTRRKRREILESRVRTTRSLGEKIRRLPAPPKVFVCASAVGYYGHRPGERLEEASLPDPESSFRAQVCTAWEEAATEATDGLPTRLVLLRLGNILGDGGLLSVLAKILCCSPGIPILGDPNSVEPWISLRDAVGIVGFVLENGGINGACNAVAPARTPRDTFYRFIAARLGKRLTGTMGRRALQRVLGAMAAPLCDDQWVVPEKVLRLGFRFQDEELTPG